MTAPEPRRPWWGGYELELNEVAKWEIGPLHLWLQRAPSEWRLAHRWTDEEATGWEFFGSVEWPEDAVDCDRYAVRETGEGVLLRTMPADRAVVARPRIPLHVLPGQSARVYMSSPLWVEVCVGAAPTVLRELATKPLSDTWFGANTREGELAYALKTAARTNPAEMPPASYRFSTPVVIENRATDPLLVERMSLPVPFLSIFSGEGGQAWSEEVHLLRTEDGDLAELDIRQGPPAEAIGATKLSEPRRVAQVGHLIRAFGSLLGLE